MGKIPEYYRAGADPVIQTFNYTDMAEGTGVTQFNLSNHQEETVVTPFLTTSSIRGDEITMNQNIVGEILVAQKEMDLDFDVEFNLPNTLFGNAYFEFTWGLFVSNNYNGTAFVIAKLRKWDGTTETEISSATSETISITGGGQTVQKSTMLLPITTEQSLNVGQSLRLTVEIWVTKSNALGNADIAIGTDPTNQDATFHSLDFDPTTGKLYIPFKLNI